MHWKKAPGHPDINYPGRKVAIFVNGCFWHRCPRCNPTVPKSNSAFWEAKFEANRERDQRNIEALELSGWTVVTIWECQIYESPSSILSRLQRYLSGHTACVANLERVDRLVQILSKSSNA